MSPFKIFIHLLLLITTPTFLLYPQSPMLPPHRVDQVATGWVCPTTYDEILQMLEELESGELKKRCSPVDLEKVNGSLAASWNKKFPFG